MPQSHLAPFTLLHGTTHHVVSFSGFMFSPVGFHVFPAILQTKGNPPRGGRQLLLQLLRSRTHGLGPTVFGRTVSDAWSRTHGLGRTVSDTLSRTLWSRTCSFSGLTTIKESQCVTFSGTATGRSLLTPDRIQNTEHTIPWLWEEGTADERPEIDEFGPNGG